MTTFVWFLLLTSLSIAIVDGGLAPIGTPFITVDKSRRRVGDSDDFRIVCYVRMRLATCRDSWYEHVLLKSNARPTNGDEGVSVVERMIASKRPARSSNDELYIKMTSEFLVETSPENAGYYWCVLVQEHNATYPKRLIDPNVVVLLDVCSVPEIQLKEGKHVTTVEEVCGFQGQFVFIPVPDVGADRLRVIQSEDGGISKIADCDDAQGESMGECNATAVFNYFEYGQQKVVNSTQIKACCKRDQNAITETASRPEDYRLHVNSSSKPTALIAIVVVLSVITLLLALFCGYLVYRNHQLTRNHIESV